MIFAPLAIGALRGLFEMTLLRKLYKANIVYQVLMTFGIALMGRELIIMIYCTVENLLLSPISSRCDSREGHLFSQIPHIHSVRSRFGRHGHVDFH